MLGGHINRNSIFGAIIGEIKIISYSRVIPYTMHGSL